MSLRIPLWPGLAVSFGGKVNPQSVDIKLHRSPDARTTRLVSFRGFMLLGVRYDWRAAVTAPVVRVEPVVKCGESSDCVVGFDPVGPCVLRPHEGPVHQAADGAKWWRMDRVWPADSP